MGDFNEVWFASERYGTIFHASHADIFNSFIIDSHLFDVPLGGYSFTWSNKHASKMSKLDRESYMDYGPTPFCLFHSWFLENDFVSVVEDVWNNAVVHDLNAMIFLKNKFASPDSIRVPLDGNFPRCSEAGFSNQLEEEVSNVEIKNAVWDCGSDKSP
ncbi:hypothetical protein Tco_0875583 [Tanacetum coccineum]|uniref:RNA-directed DNA polymerase, eukaryota n=1 Tax=Tanacetum coccineum TaxID=301880 RepID=A0ABQ5BSQ5_9ASTR